MLESEGRGKRLKQAHAQITGRRCRMVATLGSIFSIGPLTGVLSSCNKTVWPGMRASTTTVQRAALWRPGSSAGEHAWGAVPIPQECAQQSCTGSKLVKRLPASELASLFAARCSQHHLVKLESQG